MYNDVNLFIDGAWTAPEAGKMLVVINPATGEPGRCRYREQAAGDQQIPQCRPGLRLADPDAGA